MPRIEKRKNHKLLYIAVDGQQAIRLPSSAQYMDVMRIAYKYKPGTPSRRKRIVKALNQRGIKAT